MTDDVSLVNLYDFTNWKLVANPGWQPGFPTSPSGLLGCGLYPACSWAIDDHLFVTAIYCSQMFWHYSVVLFVILSALRLDVPKFNQLDMFTTWIDEHRSVQINARCLALSRQDANTGKPMTCYTVTENVTVLPMSINRPFTKQAGVNADLSPEVEKSLW